MHRRRRRDRHERDRFDDRRDRSYDDRYGDQGPGLRDGVHPEVERFISHMNDYFDGWRGRRSYTHHVGDPGPGPNRHRLSRNRRDGKIAGVCAGVADYFGFRTGHVRAAAVILAIFFWPTVILYGAAAFLMPRGEPISMRYEDPSEERFWRNYSLRPRVTYSELRHRFRALDARIAEMEHAVTSNEYSLRKQFRDLESGA